MFDRPDSPPNYLISQSISNLSVLEVITLLSSLENTAQVKLSLCFPLSSQTNLPLLESQIFAVRSADDVTNHLSSVLVQFKEFICLECALISCVHLIL